jgi:hypothetical protein
MHVRLLFVVGIPLAITIGGFMLRNDLVGLIGVLGLVTALRFTQLDRWHDREQTEMYLPTYKKEWEDKKKRR